MNERRISRSVREAIANVQPNVIDRAIEGVFPGWGMKRRAARYQMAAAEAYHGASRTRRQMSEYKTVKGSPDDELEFDLDTLRERSQDMHRNSMIARGIFGTYTTAAIGTGLKLNAAINDKVLKMERTVAQEYESQIEAEFCAWAESTFCDITRDTNFYGLQSLAFRMSLIGGDSFAVLPMLKDKEQPYELKVQLIEAERVANPNGKMADENIRGGIKFYEHGKPISVFVLKKHPHAFRGVTMEHDEIQVFGAKSGRRNVIHVYERLWAGQSRGEPILAPILEPLRILDRWTEAELMATVVSAMFTVFVKSEQGQGFGPMEGLPEASEAPQSRNAERDGFKMGNAAILDLAAGEDVTFADPKRPNTTFDIFFQAILRQVGMALEIPYEVLIKHFTASYSAARAAMLEAWRMFSTRRQWFAFRFCQPIYEAFVEEAVLKGRLNLPGFAAGDALIRQAWLGARWTGPGRGQIDELKEAQAADFKIKAGLSTLALEVPALTGEDWEDIITQRAREQAFIAEQGVDTRTPEEKAAEEKKKEEGEEGDEEKGDKEEGDKEDKELPGKPPAKVPPEQ